MLRRTMGAVTPGRTTNLVGMGMGMCADVNHIASAKPASVPLHSSLTRQRSSLVLTAAEWKP